MISDLFRSPCWSRKCLVRHPQFREHDYRGLITSPDPVLNRQKITRLCYDFLSQIWGVDFKKSTPARHVFCFVSMFAFAQQFGSQMGNKNIKRSTRFLLTVDVCFCSGIERTTLATRQPAKFNLYLRKGGSREQHATPSHLLTIFPIKPCVIFWTGLPSSVPYMYCQAWTGYFRDPQGLCNRLVNIKI